MSLNVEEANAFVACSHYSLELFAGAGGGLLASHIIGWRPVCAVELDWYNRCVLTQRQNDGHLHPAFPIWDEVRY